MRVVVLGAGALGASVALHASRADHDVTLVDETGPAAGSSGLGAGLFSHALLGDLDRRMVQASLRALGRFRGDEPLVAVRRPGSHHVAGSRDEAVALRTIGDALDELGEPVERWDADDWSTRLKARGVAVEADGVNHVLSVPADGWVDAAALTQRLVDEALRAGCRLLFGSAATHLLLDDATDFPAVGGVRLADTRRVEAERVVVALGARTRPFLEAQGLPVPTLAYRTHAAVVRPRDPLDVPILHDAPNHYYLRPAADGRIVIGDGTVLEPTETAGFATQADGGVVEGILERVAQRLPRLADARVERAWRGLLTAVPDRAPLVGEHPEAGGVILCTGGNGFGLMRSWTLGELAARLLGSASTPSWAPADVFEQLDPERFWPDPPETFAIREGFTLTP